MAPTEAEQRILDGRVWDDFCESTQGGGRTRASPRRPQGPLQPGSRLPIPDADPARRDSRSSVDYADPQYPAFFRLADETKKILNDNPDNYYENCKIDGRFDYRITGTRGTVKWLSFNVKSGGGNIDAMSNEGLIDSSQMEFDADGRFEILMSQEKKPGNWLPMTENSGMLIVRQTFGNRREEHRAEIEIECLNPDRPNNNLIPAELEPRLQQALGFLENTVSLGLKWTDDYKATTLKCPAAARPGRAPGGGRRSHDQLLPEPLGARAGRGAARHDLRHPGMSDVESTDLRLLDGVARASLFRHLRQQIHRSLRRRWQRPHPDCPRGSRPRHFPTGSIPWATAKEACSVASSARRASRPRRWRPRS